MRVQYMNEPKLQKLRGKAPLPRWGTKPDFQREHGDEWEAYWARAVPMRVKKQHLHWQWSPLPTGHIAMCTMSKWTTRAATKFTELGS